MRSRQRSVPLGWGADEPLEVHFSIGSTTNFWQYNAVFTPPAQAWQEFSVGLTSAAGWTRIIGSGTFDDALRSVTRVHLRHDLAPYVHPPNTLAGDFGVDNLSLLDATTAARGSTWGRIKSLYR